MEAAASSAVCSLSHWSYTPLARAHSAPAPCRHKWPPSARSASLVLARERRFWVRSEVDRSASLARSSGISTSTARTSFPTPPTASLRQVVTTVVRGELCSSASKSLLAPSISLSLGHGKPKTSLRSSSFRRVFYSAPHTSSQSAPRVGRRRTQGARGRLPEGERETS